MSQHARLAAPSNAVAAPASILQRECACGGTCASCRSEESADIQTKLTIGPPGDLYEQEADRVADRVVSSPAPALAAPIATTPLVQRDPDAGAEALQRMEGAEEEEEEMQAKRESLQRMEGEEEEEMMQAKRESLQRMEGEEEDEMMQPKAAGPAAPRPVITPHAPRAQAASRAGAAVAQGGRPLSTVERAYFEPRFGHDLSAIRLHADASAGQAARGINARAYTLHNHIAFAPGQLSPATTEGRRLLAHELTHTLQQGRGKTIRRAPAPPAGPASSIATPCATDRSQNCACGSGDAAAIAQGHELAVGALSRSVEHLTSHRDASARGGRRTAPMRRVDRALKRHLGVLQGDEAGLTEALGALTTAHEFLATISPRTDIRCESGIVGSPCDAAGAAAYYASGVVTFCTDQQRFTPYVAAVNVAEEDEEITQERTERIHGEKAEEALELRKGQGMEGDDATLSVQDQIDLKQEAEAVRPGVEEAEATLALSRLAATLIHEAMHHALERSLIDVYAHQQFYTELGRDRRRGPPSKALALQNPDSYLMFVYELEDKVNDAGPADPQLVESSPVKHTRKIFDLPRPIDAADDPRLDIRPVVGRRLIGTAYGQSRAAMQELMNGLAVTYVELAGGGGGTPSALATTVLDIVRDEFGFAMDLAAGPPSQTDLEVFSTMALALQQTYVQLFLTDETSIVIYRRFRGGRDATYFVQVSKHGDFKELGPGGRVAEILGGLPLDRTFITAFANFTPLINAPPPTLSTNLQNAALRLSTTLGILSQ